MSRLTLLMFAVGLFAATFPGQKPGGDTGNKLTSTEGRFSILLPANFEPYAFESRKSGALLINEYSASAERGTWTVAYYDVSPSIFQKFTVQQVLDASRDGTVKSGVLKREDAITVNGLPGRSVVSQDKSGEHILYSRSVFVIDKPRIYNYLFLSLDKAELDKPDIKKFFDSFTVKH